MPFNEILALLFFLPLEDETSKALLYSYDIAYLDSVRLRVRNLKQRLGDRVLSPSSAKDNVPNTEKGDG
jgi:hypothetical protein